MFHATLIIMSRKYFFRFSKFATTLRYTILDSRFPPENAISEGTRQASPLKLELGSGSSRYRRYLSRMTWIENFLSQNFSKFFSKPLFSTIYVTLFIISRNFFFKIGKNENFDYKINENCPIGITKIGKKRKF